MEPFLFKKLSQKEGGKIRLEDFKAIKKFQKILN